MKRKGKTRVEAQIDTGTGTVAVKYPTSEVPLVRILVTNGDIDNKQDNRRETKVRRRLALEGGEEGRRRGLAYFSTFPNHLHYRAGG